VADRSRKGVIATLAPFDARFVARGGKCTVLEGETSDTVQFKRSGANGELTVAADRFDLKAKLGFLLGAFATTIAGEILKNLDALVAKSSAKPAAKKAAKK